MQFPITARQRIVLLRKELSSFQADKIESVNLSGDVKKFVCKTLDLPKEFDGIRFEISQNEKGKISVIINIYTNGILDSTSLSSHFNQAGEPLCLVEIKSPSLSQNNEIEPGTRQIRRWFYGHDSEISENPDVRREYAEKRSDIMKALDMLFCARNQAIGMSL